MSVRSDSDKALADRPLSEESVCMLLARGRGSTLLMDVVRWTVAAASSCVIEEKRMGIEVSTLAFEGKYLQT